MIHGIAMGCIALGIVFFFGATVGLLRFPDFYSRVHAAGKGDTLSSMLMLFGLGVLVLEDGHAADILVFIKIMMICVFVFLTSPTTTHALTDAGYAAGVKPWDRGEHE
ncbi:MAG: monovalent cation/H(+) antiporter subunit G [Acidobacteria bacterium]|nr:monovalent cation/H(+) antiporter subunit G [Acidobacteriota bacterium]